MIRWKQEDMDMPSFGLTFNNPDFVKLADSFGAHGYRVNKTEDLKTILQEAIDKKGVHIIDCPVEYSQNLKDLGAGLQEEIRNI